MRNYRPISLISHLCKLYMKILMIRMEADLDRHQPPEQAGFRSNYSTTDHIFTINQLIEKCNEYNKKIFFCFVDYQKAFDTLEHVHIWKALKDQGICDKYIRIVKNIYENSTSKIKLERTGRSFKINRGVRQGDPFSPKLFNAVLQSIFAKMNWKDKGLVVNGVKLNNLRFADDGALIAETAEELNSMLIDLVAESEKTGLLINWKKTKIMSNMTMQEFKVGNNTVEVVKEFKYLGTNIAFEKREDKEVNKRISSAWRAFWSYKRFFTNEKLAIYHKRRLMDMVILPVFTYGAATWSLSDHSIHRLQVEQRAMERIFMKVSLRQKLRNEKIRKKSKIIDVADHAKQLKWRWAGHVARQDSNRWSKIVEDWEPKGKRAPGRPNKRWKDDIVVCGSIFWKRKAQNRQKWKDMEISFVQL